MNHLKFILLCCLLTGSISFARAIDESSDSTGMPGDNFSLQGALEMFKKASSLEDFEKQLNSEDNAVNNLDLNGDGDIDYVRVIDKSEGSSHAIILQVPVNESESQDIAVIEIEKDGNESAILQIEGDEEIYGDTVLVEPFSEKEVKKKGPFPSEVILSRMIVNVWLWPCVKFIYAPSYVAWVSPWKWHYYPTYWIPWRPHPWRWHYSQCSPYLGYHHVVYVHRVVVAHRIYTPYRKTSVVVVNRHKVARENYRVSHQNNGSRRGQSMGPQQKNSRNNKQMQQGPKSGAKMQQAPRGGGNRGGKGGGGAGRKR